MVGCSVLFLALAAVLGRRLKARFGNYYATLIAEAEGKAKASQIEGEALRANPEILRQRAIEKWNGQMPTYLAGNGQLPLIAGK